jgi:hypothetical protein
MPGEYRVFVPGLGVSGPFRIAADVWDAPFKAALQGLLTQRHGIELRPPACAYRRPRTFHPDDGVEFYQLDIPYQAGQEGTRGERLLELAKAGPLQRVDGVWGGYQDAGDWDTLGHHLGANPDNLSYCTSVGDHAQHFNFIVDAQVTGQQPDVIVGHIPYGQGNEGNAIRLWT